MEMTVRNNVLDRVEDVEWGRSLQGLAAANPRYIG